MEATPEKLRDQLATLEKVKRLVDRLDEVVDELIDVAEFEDDNKSGEPKPVPDV